MAFFEFLAAQLDALAGKFIKPVGGVDGAGKARGFRSDYRGTVFVEGSDRLTDAFNRFRVSEPFGLFDAKQVLDNSPQFYGTILAGSGTAPHSTDKAGTTMTLTTASGDSVIRQSLSYIPYQPGRSQQIFITGVMGSIKANVRQRIGYFDTDNGIFFEQDGTNLKVVRRTHVSGSPVDNAVNQSAWNIDKLDGTGRSGVTLDTSKNQIFVFDFGWLGVDFIRFGFVINGEIIYCHAIYNSNVLTDVWCSMPFLPVRWEITNTGTAASGTTMLQVCSAVFSEGGADALGLLGSANTGNTQVAVTNVTPTPILSVRLKTGFKRAVLVPLDFTVAVRSADYFYADIYVGGTLSGGAAVVTAVTDAVESVTGNTTLTGGRKIGGFVASSQNRDVGGDLKSQRYVASDISGTPELLSVVITPLTGNSNYHAVINWREIY
jgi:hypothetical protein